MLITQSTLFSLFSKAFAAICSSTAWLWSILLFSREYGREYTPGRSVILQLKFVVAKEPCFLSTVTPAQLPTFCFNPVNWLKSVVLPVFGLPII